VASGLYQAGQQTTGTAATGTYSGPQQPAVLCQHPGIADGIPAAADATDVSPPPQPAADQNRPADCLE